MVYDVNYGDFNGETWRIMFIHGDFNGETMIIIVDKIGCIPYDV